MFKKHPTIDITHKTVPTWYGGTKVVPTSKSEQRKMKAEILKRDPKAIVVDSAEKNDLDWIDVTVNPPRIFSSPKHCETMYRGNQRLYETLWLSQGVS